MYIPYTTKTSAITYEWIYAIRLRHAHVTELRMIRGACTFPVKRAMCYMTKQHKQLYQLLSVYVFFDTLLTGRYIRTDYIHWCAHAIPSRTRNPHVRSIIVSFLQIQGIPAGNKTNKKTNSYYRRYNVHYDAIRSIPCT